MVSVLALFLAVQPLRELSLEAEFKTPDIVSAEPEITIHEVGKIVTVTTALACRWML